MVMVMMVMEVMVGDSVWITSAKVSHSRRPHKTHLDAAVENSRDELRL